MCAAAHVIRCHGDDTIALELVQLVVMDAVKNAVVHDREVLEPLVVYERSRLAGLEAFYKRRIEERTG